ncbi:TetR/AcrR family transcriptional regulator [Acinetobacter apis]|uniref:Transcriptional regulator, TetR family n=1 Tax=Acinetobacter apis TaxID=1229165 RepID=A0A217EGD2_9GAMM|nr:TetR/AcrR family transcriptional regulator [Acinetobacter apis]SNQ29372.1 transcriptional regulator, TetR family [Acinetobacter apis]
MSKSALKILETAEFLFNQLGFTRVGVDLIRDQSGCSKTTLYTHFKNKNELIRQVLILRDRRFREELQAYVRKHDWEDALIAIFDWHFEWFQSKDFKGCLFVRAVGESSESEEDISIQAKIHKIWMRNFIHEVCKQQGYSVNVAELAYNLIEGLTSRFLVEGYDHSVAAEAKHTIIRVTQLL